MLFRCFWGFDLNGTILDFLFFCGSDENCEDGCSAGVSYWTTCPFN